MVASLRRFRQANSAATAVEFSLVIVPLLLVLMGAIEFGRFMWTRESLQSAANAGARCMGVVQTACASSGAYSADKTKTYVIGEASAMSIPLTNSDVTLNHSATCAGVTGFSQVSISYTFQTAVPQLLGSLSDGVPITATACFPNQS
jgi:Flp pilus assembly protein TadG